MTPEFAGLLAQLIPVLALAAIVELRILSRNIDADLQEAVAVSFETSPKDRLAEVRGEKIPVAVGLLSRYLSIIGRTAGGMGRQALAAAIASLLVLLASNEIFLLWTAAKLGGGTIKMGTGAFDHFIVLATAVALIMLIPATQGFYALLRTLGIYLYVSTATMTPDDIRGYRPGIVNPAVAGVISVLMVTYFFVGWLAAAFLVDPLRDMVRNW